MSIFYPKIAELDYQSKHLNVKIPIRAKMIILKIYGCNICKRGETISGWVKSINTGTLMWENSNYISTTFIGDFEVPKDLYISENIFYCPNCYARSKEKNLMIIVEKKTYKAMVNSKLDFVDMQKLIRTFFPAKWRNQYKDSLHAYFKDLETMKHQLSFYVNMAPPQHYRKKSIKIKVTMNDKLTEKDLEKAYDKYIQRKFVREL